MSEALSETNTIQKIPIPERRVDVEAFLDDIFDRALDNNNSKTTNKKVNVKQQRHTQPFHSKIKGGRNNNNIDLEVIFSNNFEFITKRNRLSHRNDNDENWNLYEEREKQEDIDYYHDLNDEYDDDDEEEEEYRNHHHVPQMPNKDYEFAKTLKTFLPNDKSSYIDKLNRIHQNSFFSSSKSSLILLTDKKVECSQLNKNKDEDDDDNDVDGDIDANEDQIYTELNENSSSFSSSSSFSFGYTNYCATTSNVTDSFSLDENTDEGIYSSPTPPILTTLSSSSNFSTSSTSSSSSLEASRAKSRLNSFKLKLNSMRQSFVSRIKGGSSNNNNQQPIPFVLFQQQQQQRHKSNNNNTTNNNFVDPNQIALMQNVYSQLASQQQQQQQQQFVKKSLSPSLSKKKSSISSPFIQNIKIKNSSSPILMQKRLATNNNSNTNSNNTNTTMMMIIKK
jgi:hypothetical protein